MGGKFSQVHYREKDTAVHRDFELLVLSWGKLELEQLSMDLRRISFNFCLSPSQFQELFQLQHNQLFHPIVQRWFDGFRNTSTSTVINGLEFVAALAITSRLTGKLQEKVAFLFDLFDFDQTGCLTRDELMILLKSSVRGLTKLTQGLGPQLAKLCPIAQMEELVTACFRHCGLDPTDDLRRDAFVQWVKATPKLTNLLKSYIPKDKFSKEEAAVCIQRVARGMLGRNFVDELRLHQRLLQDQELDVAASKIQEAMINRKRRQESMRRSKVERNACSGALYSFGANTHGLLGHEFLDVDKPIREPRQNLYFKNSDQRVIGVSASLVHASAITSAGVAYTWGACAPGAFGTVVKPTEFVRSCPNRVDDLANIQIASMALGARHSMALSSDGNIYTWGSGEFGQLGHGDLDHNELYQTQFDPHTSRSYPVIDLPLRLDKSLFDEVRIKQIACGYYFSVALAEDGCVYTWGEGSDGQLGIGLADDFQVGFLDDFIWNSNFTFMTSPQYVNLDEPIGSIGVGGNRVFAVGRNHRSVYEWGACFRRDGESLFSPKLNSKLSNLYIKSISVGKDFALAIAGCIYIKLTGHECAYALTAKFGTQPVDLYAGLSAPLIAAGVSKTKQAYAVKEEWNQKVVYVDRGKSTGVWLTVQGGDGEIFTLACSPSSFGPQFQNSVNYTGLCFYTPQKLTSLKFYVRPEEVEGKVVVLHVEESDLPVHDAEDDVSIVVERLVAMMVEKIRDAQQCGAAAVVIVFSFVADAFSLSTENAFDFSIPSVMLNASSGSRLLSFIEESNHGVITMQLYHHEDTLGEQILAIQSSGASAIVVGQNDIDIIPKRLDDSIFLSLNNPSAHAKQIKIPVLMVSFETGRTIKENYKQMIHDAFAEIGIGSFGDVYAWGAGDHGVLGLGDMDNETHFTTSYDATTNTAYSLAKDPEIIEGLVQTRIVAIACGDQHAAAVSDTGDLYTWGNAANGKLGHGVSDQDETTPRLVTALHSVKVVDVACGPQCTLVVTALSDTHPRSPVH